MIAAVYPAANQLLLFDRSADRQDRKIKKAACKKQPPTRSEIQFSLFDKHTPPPDSDVSEDPDDAIRSRRIAELMELPEYALTKEEIAELDAIVSARRERVRAQWSPKTEAKRRGFRPGWSSADVFRDDHGRILWRVETAAAVVVE